MNYDKHDLFRNVIPGYVFLLAIISIVININIIIIIKDITSWNAVILALAGLPLGYVIQEIYLTIWHEVEKKSMHKIDKGLLGLIGHVEGCKSEKYLAQKFHYYLLKGKDIDKWHERILFFASYIHSLGSSIIAIILALTGGAVCYFRYNMQINWSVFLAWTVVGIIMYIRRRIIKEDYTFAREIWANENKKINNG